MQLVFPGLETNIIDINTHIQPEFLGYITIVENVTNGLISNVTNLTNQVWHDIDVVQVCYDWQPSVRTEPKEKIQFLRCSQVPYPRKGKDLED